MADLPSTIFVVVAALFGGQQSREWDRWVVETDVVQPRPRDAFERRAAAARPAAPPPSIAVLPSGPSTLSLAYSRLGGGSLAMPERRASYEFENMALPDGEVGADELDLEALSGWTIAGTFEFLRLQIGQYDGSAGRSTFAIPNLKRPDMPAEASLRWKAELLDIALDARVLRADVAPFLAVELYAGLGWYRLEADAAAGDFLMRFGPAPFGVEGRVGAMSATLSGLSAHVSLRLAARPWRSLELGVELGERLRFGDARGDQTTLAFSAGWTF